MIQWRKRPSEIANLLNPAFCAIIVYATIAEYQRKSKAGVPFSLLYLILPIVLHKSTRNRINSRTNMVAWLHQNPDALVGFPERARSLVVFANEAIEYLLFIHSVVISEGRLEIIGALSKSKMDRLAETDSEIAECINKAAHLGRWFHIMRTEESVYAAWGVRP